MATSPPTRHSVNAVNRLRDTRQRIPAMPRIRRASGQGHAPVRGVAAASVEDFGLRLAQTREISNLGLLPIVAREAPTMRAALAALARYARLHSEALSLRLERMESTWLVCPALGTTDPASMRQ